MDLHAYTKSIGDLLSVNKKYIVPRFQREYSWKSEEVAELWKDISASIKVTNGACVNLEYFIGSLVLVGQDSSPEMKIVDGQQRLTTITILLSALTQSFKDISENNLADGLYYQYIEGKDNSNQPYFKLINETPKPFFQRSIQHHTKEELETSTEEETKLLDAYKFFYHVLSFDSTKSHFKNFDSINGTDPEKHKAVLNSLRDQILSYLKVIYITVTDEEDAYTIFETLNARGMSLSAVDLIKNLIFKDLKTQHPDDYAKTEWKKIGENLGSGESAINMDTFFRHFWLSKYGFTSEGRIYKTFKDFKEDNVISSASFLEELVNNSEYYNSIVNPNIDDWRLPEEKAIYNSLLALNLFKVVQPRPLLLALKRARLDAKINIHDHVNMIRTLENFHFSFTAISSSRASGIDGKYSKAARDLEEATDRTQARAVLASLTADLRSKVPAKSIFEQKFIKLWFTNGKTKDKKLIQYIFRTIEKNKRTTSELTTDMITLEHILPQSDTTGSSYVGLIGNLLPLDGRINNVADTAVFQQKLQHFQSSELRMVEEFINENQATNNWTESKINARSKSLSDFSYDHVWNI
ncbi:DUF262 domain-containing protein [Algoriphagus jejuensis]|uniref:DUF262 domain-containing protein n=1 Tax=Algoriphagus jejuensis TaxID=419934 RepID=A0ABP3YEN4_9BACT